MSSSSDLDESDYMAQFRVKDREEKLSVLGEPRPDLAESVISFPPPRPDNALLSSMNNYFTSDKNSNVGILGQFPLEMLVEILLTLDLKTLFTFRQTSQYAWNTINSLPAFRACMTYGRNVLCALMRTGLASKVSLNDVYKTLRTRDCTFCGNFAGFVTIMPWMRCCYRCVLGQEDVALVGTVPLMGLLDAPEMALVDHLESFTTLAGRYGIMMRCPQQKVVKYKDAARLVKNTESRSQFRRVYRYFAYLGAVALPWHDITGVAHGVGCVGCKKAATEAERNSLLNTNDYEKVSAGRDVLYSPEGLLEHFEICDKAQAVWLNWQQGQSAVLVAGMLESLSAAAVKA